MDFFRTVVISFSLSLLTINTSMAADKIGTFQQCKTIKVQMEKYTKLRRAGGDPASMEKWKKKRRVEQDKFNDLKCRKHGIIKV